MTAVANTLPHMFLLLIIDMSTSGPLQLSTVFALLKLLTGQLQSMRMPAVRMRALQ